MDFEDIVERLKKKYKNKTGEQIRAVATDLYYSGEVTALVEDEKIVESLFDRWNARNAEAAAKNQRVSAESPDHCPICKMPMKPVKLDADRPAKFCPRHFVVYPAREDK